MIGAVVPYLPQLMQGLLITLVVALSSFFLGSILAIVLAPMAVYGPLLMRGAINGYVGLIRGLPELLVIFLAEMRELLGPREVSGMIVELEE